LWDGVVTSIVNGDVQEAGCQPRRL